MRFHLIDRVDDSHGRMVIGPPGPPARAISAEVAREATAILQRVVTGGTGRAAAVGSRPVAGHRPDVAVVAEVRLRRRAGHEVGVVDDADAVVVGREGRGDRAGEQGVGVGDAVQRRPGGLAELDGVAGVDADEPPRLGGDRDRVDPVLQRQQPRPGAGSAWPGADPNEGGPVPHGATAEQRRHGAPARWS